jgi:hypothetical protein
MVKTWFDQGAKVGQLRGQRRVLQTQLERRFGPLSPEARARLESWSTERMDELSLALLEARSLQELGRED